MSDFSLGEASLGTEVDTAGLDRGIGQAEERSRSGFLNIGRIMETALGGALLAIGQNIASSVGGFIAGGMEDARGSAQLMASTEKTIETMGNAAGRSAQEVADLAAALSDANGKSLFGDDQIQQSSNLLLTFGEIKGETFDLATALTVDLAAALGGEPKAQAMMLGKALNDPVKGLSALGKAGLTFSEEQKAMIAALQEGGDMAGAQAIIIAELNKQVGGQAEAQAQAAGGAVQFQARLGEMAETVGAALLPVMDKFAAFLNDPLMPILETAATWIGTNLPPMIDQAVAAVTNFTGGLSGILTTMQPVTDFIGANLQPILAGLAVVLLTVVVPAFIGWATAAGTAALATITAMAPVVLPILAIGAAVAVLTAAWQNDWGGIRTTITDFWNTTGRPIFDQLKVWLADNIPIALRALSDLWTGTLQPALNAVWAFISTYVIPILKVLATEVLADVKSKAEAVATFWTGTLKPAFEAVKAFVQDTLAPALTTLATTVFGGIKTGMQGISDFWTETLKPAFQGMKSFLTDTVGPALSTFKTSYIDPIVTAWNNVKDAIGWVIGKIQDFIDKIGSVTIPDWLQGHSPPPMANWFGFIADEAGKVADIAGGLAFPGIGGIGSAAMAGAGGAAGAGVHITLEERGLRDLIRVTVKEEFGTAGRNADTRSRTGF